MRRYVHNKPCIRMLIAVVFRVPESGKQLNVHQQRVDKQIVIYIHTEEYYSSIKCMGY